MEPPMISDIYKKSIVPKTTKQTKHRLDEYEEQSTFDHESPMHKAQKLDDAELQEILTQVQDENGNFKEINFDVESFLKELSETTTIPSPVADATSSHSLGSASIKIDKTLDELTRICDAPIEKTTVEEYEIIEKEIQKISDELKETAKPSTFVNVSKTFEKSEAIFIENLKMLYNSLIFKNYDFSKGAFNHESATILYEQLYKVNVYISKTYTREFAIYFGFPFYLSVRVNMLGEVFIARKNIYKLLENREEIEQIHYYSNNTGFNILDVITASKFIEIITKKKFASGFDLLSILLHIIEMYKINSEKLTFNKVTLNFEKFVILYKQVIKNLYIVPIRD
jgi:hypothetical protein